MREIKFRAWDKKTKQIIKYVTPINNEWCITFVNRFGMTDTFDGDLEYMQYTGLKDKNGKEIYEGDIVRVKHGIGDDGEDYYSEGYYQVFISSLYGIELRFKRLINKDKRNQYPIYTTLSSYYNSLGIDYMSQSFDQLAVLGTWGENHISGNRWKENHYSNDIKVIGNIYENPELSNSTEAYVREEK